MKRKTDATYLSEFRGEFQQECLDLGVNEFMGRCLTRWPEMFTGSPQADHLRALLETYLRTSAGSARARADLLEANHRALIEATGGGAQP